LKSSPKKESPNPSQPNLLSEHGSKEIHRALQEVREGRLISLVKAKRG